jgi:anti-sigma B factor antagonist
MKEFICHLSHDGSDVACIYLAAELDIASAPRLERILRQAERQARLVVLDLRDLTFMDSFGLRLIADSNHRAQRTGRRLVLLRGPSQVQRLLTVTGAGEGLELAELSEIEPAVQALLQVARSDDGMTAARSSA